MSENERFASLEAFKEADERRRSPHIRLGFWPKVGEEGAEVRYVLATNEVIVEFRHNGEVELLGEVANANLADALLRIPASSQVELAWLRSKVATAPTDEAEIANAIDAQRRLWSSYDRMTDRRDT